MPMKIRLIVEMIISLAIYGLALLWVSSIPEGTPGLIYKAEETSYEIYVAETPVIADIPYKLFEDPPITIEVNYATPSSAIEEPKKKPKEPEMEYIGNYWITGYVATGANCADGSVPRSGWTAACNSLPFGTVVYIKGLGTRVITDRGGMANDVIDVFCDSVSDCYAITGSYKVFIVKQGE